MYLPPLYREDRLEAMQAFVREYPFATLVTVGAAGLTANHIPMIYDAEPAPWGRLRGHMSKANTQLREVTEGVESLALFQGPHAYITPSSYPSKGATGEVVPTWNYAAVHVYGRVRTYTDAAWLRAHVGELTESQERRRKWRR